MSDPLLDFYERELSFIRGEAREFARRFPKIAGRLRLSDAETVEDPHVSRLIEAFALLCARLRIKMEDEFPEICKSIMQATYPQYVAPQAPTAICQFTLSEEALENPTGRLCKRGERIEADPIDGVQCLFRVCYDTQLLPISVETEYLEQPFSFPVDASWKNDVQAALRIRLASRSNQLKLNNIKLDHLRFYLHGSTVLGNDLYEACLRDAVGVAFYHPNNKQGLSLPSQVISPVGFSDAQGLSDADPRTLNAYRMLYEFFTLPEKYRFLDFNIGTVWRTAVGDSTTDLVVFLRRTHPVIRRDLRKDSLRLGCSPVTNLFEQACEPTRLTGNQTEYRIIPSARRPQGMEVISVDRVTASSPGGEEQFAFKPFFLPSHHKSSDDGERFWHSSRRRRLAEDAEGDRGTEVYLTLVDLQSKPISFDEWTLHVTTTCCNRDMVGRLPFGGGLPVLRFRNAGGVASVEMLTAPTPTLRPLGTDEYYWRLLSHLNMNHLSLQDNEKGAEALREILSLYDPSDSDETKRAVQSIESVKYTRSVGRIPSELGTGFCRGVDIDILVDEERLVGMGPYLFASVLDRFFSLFASINSFTRLTVRTVGSSEPLFVGKPRSGDRFLL